MPNEKIKLFYIPDEDKALKYLIDKKLNSALNNGRLAAVEVCHLVELVQEYTKRELKKESRSNLPR